MTPTPKKPLNQWVLAFEKDGVLVDYLRHPDFIFDNIELAVERKEDAFILLSKAFPTIKLTNIYVAPLRDFP